MVLIANVNVGMISEIAKIATLVMYQMRSTPHTVYTVDTFIVTWQQKALTTIYHYV